MKISISTSALFVSLWSDALISVIQHLIGSEGAQHIDLTLLFNREF